MEALKQPKHKSKVKQFYSEYNSDISAETSESSDSEADFFKFGVPVQAPKVTRKSHFDDTNSQGSGYSQQPPLSPSYVTSQNLQEQALDRHYQRKINDLQRNTLYSRFSGHQYSGLPRFSGHTSDYQIPIYTYNKRPPIKWYLSI